MDAVATRRRIDGTLVLVAAVAAVVRLSYVLVAKRADSNLTDEGDAFWYGAVGQLMANREGFFRDPFSTSPTAAHGPVTAILAGGAAFVSGGSVLAMRLTIALVGIGAVVAIALVAREIGGRRTGLVAGLIAAVYAGFWVNDGLVMAEAPATLVVAIALLVALRVRQETTTKRVLVLGALLGLAALVRSELVILVPLLGGAALLRRPRYIPALLAAALLVVAPWVTWNLTRFEKPTFLSTNDGLTILGSNCDEAFYGSGTGLWHLSCVLDVPAKGDESQVSSQWRADGLRYLRDHLSRLPIVAVARVGRTFGAYNPPQLVKAADNEGREPPVSWLALIQGWVLIPFAVAGAVRLRRLGQSLAVFAAPIIAVVVVSAAVCGLPRFRVSADVALVVLAAVALVRPTAT